MSHAIYTTPAIVLKREESGEADITYWLLSKSLGLIIARAQGVRKDKAKMRGHLQLFSYSKVSLVRGKYIWRITGAEQVSDHSDAVRVDSLCGDKLKAFARVATFVCRMTIINAQSTVELFERVLNARASIQVSNDLDKDELLAIADILIILGYLDSDIVSQFKIKKISQNQFAAAVNNAISESHL